MQFCDALRTTNIGAQWGCWDRKVIGWQGFTAGNKCARVFYSAEKVQVDDVRIVDASHNRVPHGPGRSEQQGGSREIMINVEGNWSEGDGSGSRLRRGRCPCAEGEKL